MGGMFMSSAVSTEDEKKAEHLWKRRSVKRKNFMNHMFNVNFYVNEREQRKLPRRYLRMS